MASFIFLKFVLLAVSQTRSHGSVNFIFIIVSIFYVIGGFTARSSGCLINDVQLQLVIGLLKLNAYVTRASYALKWFSLAVSFLFVKLIKYITEYFSKNKFSHNFFPVNCVTDVTTQF